MDMRGLVHFIRDIRKAADNLREEKERVEEELAKVRSKFIDSVGMSIYDRKKYVCKLMFISMLGYPVSFGHMEGLELIAGQTPAEKLIGYLSATVLLNQNSELLTLTAHTVYRDLVSRHDFNRGLALSAVASTGGKDFAEIMHVGVQKIILDDDTDIHIRKRALLTLLHIYQKYPAVVDLPSIIPKAADLICCGQDGVSMCAAKFLDGCVTKHNVHLFRDVPVRLADALARIIIEKKTEPGYVYYGVPAPWLQCSILRLLQRLPIPEEPHLRDRIVLILRKIIKATDRVVKDSQTQQKQRGVRNRVSIMNAVFLEAVSLSVLWAVAPKLIQECVGVVSSFVLEKKDVNFRYIGLDLLHKLRHANIPETTYHEHCKQYQPQIIVGLHDVDVSLRRKALDVLVGMCDASTSLNIIKTLLAYLPIADEAGFKADLVMSVAYISEKYIDDPGSYADIMLSVVAKAGNACPADVVYSLVSAVINNPSVQKRAVGTVFDALRSKKCVSETIVQVGAFVLGECGYQVALNPESTPLQQFTVLDSHLEFSSTATRAMILTAFFKFYSVYDDTFVREKIVKALCAYKGSIQQELQQRAMEYLALIENGNRELIERLLQPTPVFSTRAHETLGTETRNAQYARTGGSTEPEGEKIKRSSFETPTTFLLKLDTAGEVNNVECSALDELFQVSNLQDAERLKQTYLDRRRLLIPLLQGQNGVLYADSCVELWCTQVFRLADCRVSVSIQDKRGKGLEQVSLVITNAEVGLLLQSRGNDVNRVPPNGSITIDFAGRSTAPFCDPPLIQLNYRSVAEGDGSDGTVGIEVLYLPIVTTRFISPYEVSSNEDHFHLFDSLRKSTKPLSCTLSAARSLDKEPVLQGLSTLGFFVATTGDGTFMAVGAHSTKLKGKDQHTPVACELCANGRQIQAKVYALFRVVQEITLSMLDLVLQHQFGVGNIAQ